MCVVCVCGGVCVSGVCEWCVCVVCVSGVHVCGVCVGGGGGHIGRLASLKQIST